MKRVGGARAQRRAMDGSPGRLRGGSAGHACCGTGVTPSRMVCSAATTPPSPPFHHHTASAAATPTPPATSTTITTTDPLPQVTAFHCKDCGVTTEKRHPGCAGHAVTRVPATKRWWSCRACGWRLSTLNTVVPTKRCPKCDPLRGWRAGGSGVGWEGDGRRRGLVAARTTGAGAHAPSQTQSLPRPPLPPAPGARPARRCRDPAAEFNAAAAFVAPREAASESLALAAGVAQREAFLPRGVEHAFALSSFK